jgi:hypothetical protein
MTPDRTQNADGANWDTEIIGDQFEHATETDIMPKGPIPDGWARCSTRCLIRAMLCKHLLYGGETYAMCNRNETVFANGEQITGLGPETRQKLREAYRAVGFIVSDGIVWPPKVQESDEPVG